MLLIYPAKKDALKIFQSFLPIYVPIGLGHLLAVCEKQNLPVEMIDQQIEDDFLGTIDKYVAKMQPPYIFGFSVFTIAMGSAVETAKYLKAKYPDCVTLFGGIHPTAMPEETLQTFPSIDLIFAGEAEEHISTIYRRLKNRESVHDVPGIGYRNGEGEVVINERSALNMNLDQYPSFPYHRFESPKYDLGFILSSRGCPYKCTFCSNRITTGLAYRYRAPEALVAEMKMLHEKYGCKKVLLLDDNFLVNRSRIHKLTSLVVEEGLHKKMSFGFQARADNVRRDQMVELFEAGFNSVFYGIETASNRIMKVIRKDETIEDCIEAVKISKELGFHVSATFIFALPTETSADRTEAIRLTNELKIDMVRYNNATPYPGTVFYKEAQAEGLLNVVGYYDNFNSVSTFIEPPFKKIPFSYVPQGSTENEIRSQILWGYWRFYMNLDRLKQVLNRPDLGVGWFDAGGNIKEKLVKIPALTLLAF